MIYNEKKYTYTQKDYETKIVKRNMEAITRQLLALEDRPVVIYNYVGMGPNFVTNTTEDQNRIGRLAMPRACVDVHEMIAEKYGVPSINIDSYIQDVIVNGTEALDGKTYTQNEIYSENDSVHPNTTVGTTLYAEYMEKVVSEDPDRYLMPADTDILNISKEEYGSFDDTFHTLPYTESTISGSGWGQKIYNSREALGTSVAGDSISFDFSGKLFFVRGAQQSAKLNVEIIDKATGATVKTETKNVTANANTGYDVLFADSTLDEDGSYTLKLTLESGTLVIRGISVNGAIPEEGFKTAAQFKAEHPEFTKSITGFTSTFDGDLTDSFVDPGWSTSGDLQVSIVDGALSLVGTNDASAEFSHAVDTNDGDIIIVSFDWKNNGWGGIQLFDGDGTLQTPRFGMIYQNPAGVFFRDKDGVARRLVQKDKYWPTQDVWHNYKLIFNFAAGEGRMFEDGVEAVYYSPDAAEMADSGKGVKIAGTSLGNLHFKIVGAGTEKSPLYIDNIVVRSFPDYLSDEITAFAEKREDMTTAELTEGLAAFSADAEYIKAEGRDITDAAKASISAIETEISERKTVLIPSENNTGLVGAKELFTLTDGITAESVYLDGEALTEGEDYTVKGNKYLFSGSLFDTAGKKKIKIIDGNGGTHKDFIEIKEAAVVKTMSWKDENAKTSGTAYTAGGGIVGYSGNSANVFQVYNEGEEAKVEWSMKDLAGVYRVEWFDINALHSNGNQYQQPQLKWEVKSAHGTETVTFATNKDGQWRDMGTYTFNGSEDEYVKIQNGSSVGMNPGCRFFTEGIRLVESYDDSVLVGEFADLPSSFQIKADSETGVAGVAKIFTLSEDFDREYIKSVTVDGATVSFEKKGRNILVPGEALTGGEHSISATLVNSASSNSVTVNITEPEHIEYALTSATIPEFIGRTDDTKHSRHMDVKVAKLTLRENDNGEMKLPDGKSTEDIYVKWDIGEISSGDYLVDAWLPSGWLAAECKVEVCSEGGEKTTVYRSVHAGNLSTTDSMWTEFYLGNGDKITFTGNGEEYIKIMLDDDYNIHEGRHFMADSVRLTPWYDMNGVYDEFYGDDVLKKSGISYQMEEEVIGVDNDGNEVKQTVTRVICPVTSNYAMHKYGYTAYLGVYEDGKLVECRHADNIMLYDGVDQTFNVKFTLSGDFDPTGKTVKVFLWGGDSEPDNNTSMKPYVK